jgi:hypothetical protein
MRSLFPPGIPLEWYSRQSKDVWPTTGQQVVACHTKDTIMLYQAFKPSIAKPAALHQDFVTENPDFLPGRMTWVKPNFLWMMYRCGWASKKDQERVLMFEVDREWFEGRLLPSAALSTSHARADSSVLTGEACSPPDGVQWPAGAGKVPTVCRTALAVVQWDPDHSPSGAKHPSRRAIQIGMRNALSDEWALGVRGPAIRRIHDITEFVRTVVAEGEKTETVEVVDEATDAGGANEDAPPKRKKLAYAHPRGDFLMPLETVVDVALPTWLR